MKRGQIKYLAFPLVLIVFVIALGFVLNLGLQEGERTILILFLIIILAILLMVAYRSVQD